MCVFVCVFVCVCVCVCVCLFFKNPYAKLKVKELRFNFVWKCDRVWMKRVKFCLNYAVQKAGGTRVLSSVTEFKECTDNVKRLQIVAVWKRKLRWQLWDGVGSSSFSWGRTVDRAYYLEIPKDSNLISHRTKYASITDRNPECRKGKLWLYIVRITRNTHKDVGTGY